jgi:hypothetical protein
MNMSRWPRRNRNASSFKTLEWTPKLKHGQKGDMGLRWDYGITVTDYGLRDYDYGLRDYGDAPVFTLFFISAGRRQ